MKYSAALIALLLAGCSGSSSETDNKVDEPEIAEIKETPDTELNSVDTETIRAGTHVYSAGNAGVDQFVSGWSAFEAWGTWTNGAEASLRFTPMLEDPSALHVYFMVFPPPRIPEFEQSVGVVINGVAQDTWTFGETDSQSCTHRIIELVGDSSAPYDIQFTIGSPMSPKDAGMSEDDRKIGMGLVQIIEATAGAGEPTPPCS